MFNLDHAIAAWRRSLTHNAVFLPDDCAELEQHLRDQIAGLMAQGYTAEAAFQQSISEMGDYAHAEAEYGKVYWGKMTRPGPGQHALRARGAMLLNYGLVALRTLRRRLGYAVLHLAGLAVGLACCFIVLLYVQDELSYDRFHTKADRLFQLSQTRTFNDQDVGLLSMSEKTAEGLVDASPDVLGMVQLESETGLLRRPERNESFEEDEIVFASEGFFELFTFPLLAGRPADVLAAPGQVVLSQSIARKYFGNADPIGQVLLLEREARGGSTAEPIALTVAGMAADAPHTSSIQFDVVISGSTEVGSGDGRAPRLQRGLTYILIRSPGDQEGVATVFAEILQAIPTSFGTFKRAEVKPITDLHFTYFGERTFAGRTQFMYLFSIIAGLVLLIACINYVNLATAYAARRAKEVGVRKSLGANRWQLARQFLLETFMLTTLAGGLALLLVWLVLPAFNRFFDKAVALSGADDVLLFLGMAGVVGVVGLIAGSYPAVYLSRFQPSVVLKGTAQQGSRRSWLRQGLVVFQFTATVVLLMATFIVQQQLDFSQNRDLGFSGDQVLTMDLSASSLTQQRVAMQQTMLALPGVEQAALSSVVPGAFGSIAFGSPTDTANDPSDDVLVYIGQASPEFRATYGLQLQAGQFITPNGDGVVINETTGRRLGIMTIEAAEAVGQEVMLGRPVTVAGVVKDFHFKSVHDEIEPLALWNMAENPNAVTLSLKLSGDNLVETMEAIEAAWAPFAGYYPFTYRFVDEAFDAMYRQDQQLGQIFGMMSGIAILLSCFGLLGLIAFAAERRMKEVGIRKALGASARDIVVLLAREFALLVGLGIALAAPIAYVSAQKWLEDFAYRIDLGPGVFLFASTVALLIALLTVGYQALKTAHTNPVEALRGA
ncbi:MAG: FtsX-like permease family protein [Bacteroidota bacterium]